MRCLKVKTCSINPDGSKTLPGYEVWKDIDRYLKTQEDGTEVPASPAEVVSHVIENFNDSRRPGERIREAIDYVLCTSGCILLPDVKETCCKECLKKAREENEEQDLEDLPEDDDEL